MQALSDVNEHCVVLNEVCLSIITSGKLCNKEAKLFMAVTPSNALDKRLVELYSEKVTVNLNHDASVLSPDEVLRTMQVIAINNKAFLKI